MISVLTYVLIHFFYYNVKAILQILTPSKTRLGPAGTIARAYARLYQTT
jgi:hypothetical protein